jgi:hypothetical protein
MLLERDQIANFWLKQLTVTHKYLATHFNKLTEEEQIQEWLTAGLTVLMPRYKDTERPKNYRPVTCLPTM